MPSGGGLCYRRRGGGLGRKTMKAETMSALPITNPGKIPHGQDGVALPVSELGTAFRVKGLLETEGDLYVYGKVLGRINARRVIVGVHGAVEGDVVARDVRIAGRLIGRVFALNVTVEASADIEGRIFHHTIAVERGARIDGRMPWRPPSYFETLDQLPETRP